MCVIACTLKANTTSNDNAWPIEISQKALVRSASRGVNMRRSGAASVGVRLLAAGGTPSTVSPMSSGRLLITRASGQPTTIMMTPEANAVVRQPKVWMHKAVTNTKLPPTAPPN